MKEVSTMPLLNKKIKVSLPKLHVSKTHRHIPILQLVIVVAAVATIGAYFAYKSMAATPVVAALQSEAMSQPTGASIVADTAASGSQALKLTQDGSATATLTIPSQASSVVVQARSTQCFGSPTVSVAVDGLPVLSTTAVSSTSYAGYTTATPIKAGTHTIALTASNLGTVKKGKKTCAKTLYLDVTTLFGPEPVATPAPTVTFSASSTSITSGGSSTLTWNSTNATSCNASGGWSGAKAVSGNETVKPVSNTQYSISCTGAGGSASGNLSIAVASTSTTTTGSTNTTGSSLGFNTLNTASSDDFTGTVGTKPDGIRWHAKNFGASNGSVVYWNAMNNVQLDGTGNLDIFAQRASDGTHWNSAWLSGNKSYAGAHYIEARAKVATGLGTWSAPIWEWDAPYGSKAIENDVIEQLGKEPQAYHTTTHSGGPQVSKTNATPVILSNDFHTYGSAVYPDHVDYYYDGTKIQSITKTEMGGLWGYVENPMVLNVVLDMGGWGGTPSTSLPSTVHMLVDYVRVYTP